MREHKNHENSGFRKPYPGYLAATYQNCGTKYEVKLIVSIAKEIVEVKHEPTHQPQQNRNFRRSQTAWR
jgi:hypothetical protein